MSIYSKSRLCILIIDDDEHTLELSRRLVHQAIPAALIVTACGAEDGIDYLIQARKKPGKSTPLPTIILLDLNMPILNGFDFLRWMSLNEAFTEIKVVMLTSSEADEDVKRATELGAQGYLIKYPSIPVLAASLSEAVSHSTLR